MSATQIRSAIILMTLLATTTNKTIGDAIGTLINQTMTPSRTPIPAGAHNANVPRDHDMAYTDMNSNKRPRSMPLSIDLSRYKRLKPANNHISKEQPIVIILCVQEISNFCTFCPDLIKIYFNTRFNNLGCVIVSMNTNRIVDMIQIKVVDNSN